MQVLHEHLTASVCQTVFEQTRTTERARKWTLEALGGVRTAVILQAPQSLTQALEEAAAGTGAGWLRSRPVREAFFERCQSFLYLGALQALRGICRPCAAPRRARVTPSPCSPCASTFRTCGWWMDRARSLWPIASSCGAMRVCVARLSDRFL